MTIVVGTFFIFCRTAAMLLVAPVLGDKSVPIYIKAILALTISLAIAPLVLEQNQLLFSFADLQIHWITSKLINEAIIGTLLGLGILIIFSAALMIGSAIGQISGLQIDSFSPNNSLGQRPTTQLIGFTAIAVFVLIGGPEMLVASIMDSFVALPIGHTIDLSAAVTTLTTLLQQSFELTIRAVAPAIGTLLISTTLIGTLSRTMPQLNLVQVGLASNHGLMMAALFLTLGGCAWLAVDDVERASDFINESFRESGPSIK